MNDELVVADELSELRSVVAEQGALIADLKVLVASSPHRPRRQLWRSRWAAIGAAVAVSLGVGAVYVGNAASGSASSSFVAIAPVRILDTRTDLGLAGPFTSPTPRDLLVTGTIATATGPQLVVPAGATAVALNVTVVGPSAAGFLSVRPANAAGPATTSNLNFGAGAVVPNAVTVQVPTSGGDAGKIEITFDAFSVAGPTTHVLVDIVGYYRTDLISGTIPSGVTVTGFESWIADGDGAAASNGFTVNFPASAPVAPTSVNFASDAFSTTDDDDASCTGSLLAPTAPPGQVCAYWDNGSSTNVTYIVADPLLNGSQTGFLVSWDGTGTVAIGHMSWAYTAP